MLLLLLIIMSFSKPIEPPNGVELKNNIDGTENPKYIDLLDEDKSIAGQKFACLSFISIPFILSIVAPIVIDGTSVLQKLSFLKLSLALLLITTLPVFLGIFINTKFSTFVEKINKFYSTFSLLLFMVIILAAWISEWSTIIVLYKSIGLMTLSLAIVVLITSYTLVKLLNLNEANKKAIIIEAFIQNAAMAIVVGGTNFVDKSGYLAIAGLYALLQYKILLLLWAGNKIFIKSNNL